MKQMKKEDAVSPVVGVMLMLVVTIVIAAVVAAFAGGLAEDTSKIPVASFKADVTAKDTIIFTLMGGDALVPSSINVIVKQGNSVLASGKPTASGGSPVTVGDTLTIKATGGSFQKSTKTYWEVLDADSGQVISSGSLMANY